MDCFSGVLSGRVILCGQQPATLWLANFRLSLRDSFGLFHLFDDEHFDWLTAGHEFEAELCKLVSQS